MLWVPFVKAVPNPTCQHRNRAQVAEPSSASHPFLSCYRTGSSSRQQDACWTRSLPFSSLVYACCALVTRPVSFGAASSSSGRAASLRPEWRRFPEGCSAEQPSLEAGATGLGFVTCCYLEYSSAESSKNWGYRSLVSDTRITDLLVEFNDFNLEGRYPDEKESFRSRATESYTLQKLVELEELLRWISQRSSHDSSC